MQKNTLLITTVEKLNRRFQCQLGQAEERISKLKSRVVEVIQSEESKKMKKSEDSLRNLYKDIK